MGQRSQEPGGPSERRRRSGAKREFERFVAQTTDGLFRAAYLMTWDSAASEDLVQEAYIKVARRWVRVRAMEHPYAYARRVLVNLVLDGANRRTLHRQELTFGDEPVETIDDDTRLALERVTEADALGQALSRLTPRQRMVLVLRYWEDISESDVAIMLGCTTGTVKSTASRAAARLAAELSSNLTTAQGGNTP